MLRYIRCYNQLIILKKWDEILKKELHKSFVNARFLIIVLMEGVIAILHSYHKVSEYITFKNNLEIILKRNKMCINPYSLIYNAYSSWIGCDKDSIYAKVLFYIFPLCASITYSWSFICDYKKGYYFSACKKYGKHNYHLYKYIAVFLSSGSIAAIPLLLNFFSITLFIPLVSPDSVYDIYYGIFSGEFMAELYYNTPLAYLLIFILLCFIYNGLFGCLSYTISIYIKNAAVSISLPYLILICVELLKSRITQNTNTFIINFSPLSFLYAAKSHNANLLVVLVIMITIFGITFYFSVSRYLDIHAIRPFKIRRFLK